MRGTCLFVILLDGFDEIFLEERDDFFDVPGRDHFQGDFQCFVANVKVGT